MSWGFGQPAREMSREEWAALVEAFDAHEISDEQRERQEKYRRKLDG